MAPLMVPRRSPSEDLGLRALAQEMRAIARRLAAVTRPGPAPRLAWQPVARRPRLRFLRGGLWPRR
jgi:hypothetical protein